MLIYVAWWSYNDCKNYSNRTHSLQSSFIPNPTWTHHYHRLTTISCCSSRCQLNGRAYNDGRGQTDQPTGRPGRGVSDYKSYICELLVLFVCSVVVNVSNGQKKEAKKTLFKKITRRRVKNARKIIVYIRLSYMSPFHLLRFHLSGNKYSEKKIKHTEAIRWKMCCVWVELKRTNRRELKVELKEWSEQNGQRNSKQNIYFKKSTVIARQREWEQVDVVKKGLHRNMDRENLIYVAKRWRYTTRQLKQGGKVKYCRIKLNVVHKCEAVKIFNKYKKKEKQQVEL